MFHCNPTYMDSRIPILVGSDGQIRCVADPEFQCHTNFTVTRFPLPLEFHCRWNSTGTQNRVSLEFDCHPKTSAVGFLRHNVINSHPHTTYGLLQFLLTLQGSPISYVHSQVYCRNQFSFQVRDKKTPPHTDSQQ
jgi:hypothetical protein